MSDRSGHELDESQDADVWVIAAGGGSLGRPIQGGVQVGGLDHPDAADLLLGLRVGPVGGDDLAALGTDDRGRGRWMQTAPEHPDASRLHFAVEGIDRLVGLLYLLL